MDSLAISAGNILVGNPTNTEGLEIIVLPNVAFELESGVDAVVAITGRKITATVHGALVSMWTRVTIPQGGRLRLEVTSDDDSPNSGFRVYICIRGGFPGVPPYLGSKSTSMGLGGYQVCAALSRRYTTTPRETSLMRG